MAQNNTDLLKIIVNALEDVKGQSITVFDTREKTSAFDHVVIASGTSNRQTRALADSVVKAVKHAKFKVSGLEGTETGEWVLVDCGSVVVHCMQPSIRQYYDLEELWGPDALDLKALFSKKPTKDTVQKEVPEKTAEKRSTRKSGVAKKPTIEKAAPAKKTTAKKVTTKKTAAEKTTPKKATPRKAAPKKSTKA